MPATASRPTAEEVDRYIELDALETLLTSGYALGGAIRKHLKAVDIKEQGFDLIPLDDQPGLIDLFGRVMPDEVEGSPAGSLIHARVDLTIARMLRSITPEQLAWSASYFEALADSHLRNGMDANA